MSDDIFVLARENLLSANGLGEQDLDHGLAALMGPGVDAADLYFQRQVSENWALEDGIVKEGSFSIEQGVGTRAIAGEKVGFAYTDELSLPAILQASANARAIVRSGAQMQASPRKKIQAKALYEPLDPISSMGAAAKVTLLQEIDAFARSLDPRVKQVMLGLSANSEHVLLVHSDGTLAADIRPLVHFRVHVVVESNGRRESGMSGGGGRLSYSQFLSGEAAKQHAREAVRVALVSLDARSAPAGSMPVVLGPGWPGVLLHEAVGHGLESDFNRKGSSAFSGRIGEKVASSLCTVVDDGTLWQRRGSLSVDDEGTPTGTTTLIENGVLKGYLQDKHNASLTGAACTGNGRRESFASLPMPRMTNTYMLAGKSDPAEILASIDKGLYAVNFAGGQVDITSGKFVFSAAEAYWVEKGKIMYPVKGATLIGNGPDVMQRISMVGHDLQLDLGVGVCGKEGQSVPVGVGQPTLKIDQLTVGGTAG
jgi:TldD protein